MTDESTDFLTEVSTEAKRSFSLSDRIKGISKRKSKVLIFTDAEATDAYANHLQLIADKKVRLNVLLDNELREAQAEVEYLEQQSEQLAETMLEGALSFHLSGTSNILIQKMQRAGRKQFSVKGGTVPDDKQEEFSDWLTVEYFLLAIEKVVDSSGAEATVDRDDIIELRDSLPTSQWRRLDIAVNAILFLDGYEKVSTDDPGF